MPSNRTKTCSICGAKIARGNRTGHCRTCATKQRAKEYGDFKQILQVFQEADPQAQARFRLFLEKATWRAEATLARTRGTQLAVQLSHGLTRRQIEELWQLQQYRVNLPAIAVDASPGLAYLTYFNDCGQDHSTDEMRRHFEAAIRNRYPHMQITWLPDPPPRPKPN